MALEGACWSIMPLRLQHHCALKVSVGQNHCRDKRAHISVGQNHCREMGRRVLSGNFNYVPFCQINHNFQSRGPEVWSFDLVFPFDFALCVSNCCAERNLHKLNPVRGLNQYALYLLCNLKEYTMDLGRTGGIQQLNGMPR